MDIKRWTAALALSVAFAAHAMDVSGPQGAFALKDKPRGGQPGFCAEELAAALKGTLGRDEVSHYPVVSLNGRRILLSTTSALVSVDGKIVRLQQAPSASDGCLWLPAEFLTAVLPQVLGGPVSVKGLDAKAAPADAKPESKPETKAETKASQDKGDRVVVESVVASDSVRITFLGRAALLGEVAQGSKDVTATFSDATLVGNPGGLGKGIVDDLQFEKGGHRAKIQLGAGFKRFESVKLRNPDRLVLLFRGEGQRVVSPAPEPPPAPEPIAVVPPMTGEPPKKSSAFDTVVLDPGHGGPDTGATTVGGLQEKNLTLVLAQKTAALLEKEGIKAILTRNTDVQVPLLQRTALANFNRANLFLSIHLNSSPASSARGTETYYLSRNATDQWSSQLAAKENTADEASGATGDGGLNLVLWELAQTSYIVESAALAEAIQQEFNALLGTADRGVRQAPFVVLEGAQMPAVLVEVAFLSNPDEGKRIADPAFQDQVAAALVKSILAFKARNEKPQTPPPQP